MKNREMKKIDKLRLRMSLKVSSKKKDPSLDFSVGLVGDVNSSLKEVSNRWPCDNPSKTLELNFTIC